MASWMSSFTDAMAAMVDCKLRLKVSRETMPYYVPTNLRQSSWCSITWLVSVRLRLQPIHISSSTNHSQQHDGTSDPTENNLSSTPYKCHVEYVTAITILNPCHYWLPKRANKGQLIDHEYQTLTMFAINMTIPWCIMVYYPNNNW